MKKANNNMGKHLHRYYNEPDFQKEYYGVMTVTAITVPVSGTFIYDRYDEENHAHIWVNEGKELWTQQRDARVGNNCGGSSGAYDPQGNQCLEVTSIDTEREGLKYIEPWVSYTTGTRTTIRTHCYFGPGMTGELEIAEVGTTDIVFDNNCA